MKHARAIRLSARRRAGATRRGDSRGSGRRPPVPVGSGNRLPVAVASIVASSPTATPAPAWLRVSGRTCSTFAATARLISRGTAVASSVIGRSGGGSPAGRSFDPRRYAAWWRPASSSGCPRASHAAIDAVEAVHGFEARSALATAGTGSEAAAVASLEIRSSKGGSARRWPVLAVCAQPAENTVRHRYRSGAGNRRSRDRAGAA